MIFWLRSARVVRSPLALACRRRVGPCSICIARRLTGGDGEVRLPSILVVAGVRRVTGRPSSRLDDVRRITGRPPRRLWRNIFKVASP